MWYSIFADTSIPVESVSGEALRVYLVAKEQDNHTYRKTAAPQALRFQVGFAGALELKSRRKEKREPSQLLDYSEPRALSAPILLLQRVFAYKTKKGERLLRRFVATFCCDVLLRRLPFSEYQPDYQYSHYDCDYYAACCG